jgi:hypothetical protein
MNLALIDPFQLAQDHPDTLTNVLRVDPFSPGSSPLPDLIRKRPCHRSSIQSQRRLSCFGQGK